MTIAGYPPMTGLSPFVQSIGYILAAVILSVYFTYNNTILGGILAIIYGILAVLSFSGVQQWINYNGASDYLGVAMALWDLVLAVAILTVEE